MLGISTRIVFLLVYNETMNKKLGCNLPMLSDILFYLLKALFIIWVRQYVPNEQL